MTQAILGNAAHPEYGVATIPFPIPRAEYANCVALLEALEIGDALDRDCQVQEICGPWPALKRLENQLVNLDELDYLAKRLDSFSSGELAQFQALAEKWELRDMTDLINLSFCCQQATVITDFSDLESVGRRHYLNTHSGCASVQELEDLDARETALLLIDSEAGTVTPYGVVYDNGATLEPVYDGQHLPCFTYAPAVLTVALRSRLEPDNVSQITWLYLPADEEQLHRALLRSGIADPEDFRFRLEDSVFPAGVEAVLDVQLESIYELNRLAQAVDRLLWDQRMKLGAVAAMAECRVQGTLEPEELDCLKDYIAGQTSDGWGEGFEQREIPVADGELYVHLWSFTGWEIQTEEERFSQRQDSPCFEQSF